MADEAEITRASFPLHGMVLCCTSVEMDERSEIQNKCEQMGARHVLDLTSEVTHLICASLLSPKYRYVSKMRPDVKVMTTAWVGAIYEDWLLGEDIDPAAYDVRHRFPVLYGLRVSVTGIADVAERKRIEETCVQEHASYHPDLSREVTHLIATAPTGRKYEFARKYRITVVTPEWLADSLERGMALDEHFYDPLLPPDRIGMGAKPPKTVVPAAEAAGPRGKRKIRKSTQDRLGEQSQSLWNDIIGHAATVRPTKRDEWEDEAPADIGRPGSAPAPRPRPGDGLGSKPQPKKGGMFASACFWPWGFDRTQMRSLGGAVLPHDGEVVGALEELGAAAGPTWKFVVVPRTTRIRDCPKIPEDATMVTEWWLESCLHYQKLIPPTGDFTTMPIEEFEIQDMKGMDICITKFTGIDLLFYPRLVRLLGANFHEVITKNRSLLITNNSRATESDKICFAHANGVPVVTGEWLVECLKQNQKLPYETYRIRPGNGPALLGDRFKGKPGNEPAGPNKKQLGLVEQKSGEKPKRKADTELRTPQEKKKKQRGAEAVGQQQEGEKEEPGSKRFQRSSPARESKELQQSCPTRNSESKGESKPKKRMMLEGCTVCVSKQLKKRDEGLLNIAKDLGATVLDSFDQGTPPTHLVHWTPPGKPLEPAKEFRLAAASVSGSCWIVSCDWLYKCRETGIRADERAFEICLGKEGEEGGGGGDGNDDGDGSGDSGGGDGDDGDGDIAMALAPSCSRSNRPEATSQQAASAGPLAERRINESHTSPPRGSTERPERKSSSLSGISEILGKFGKEQLAAAMASSSASSAGTHSRARGKLQGKATAGKTRMFSRTPSAASMAEDVAAPQAACAPSESAAEPLSAAEPGGQADTALSQALGYNYEETAMEKKIVRAKLDRNAPLETPRGSRTRVARPRGAVDLVPVARRSARKREGAAGV